MATKSNNILAAKQRKQKIILAVGGVLLIAVLALQGPKLLKQLKGSSSKPAAAAAATTTPGVTTPAAPGATTGSSSTPSTAKPGKGAAQLAGIVLAPAARPSATQGQLWSFSRFKAKDPFVQQVQDTSTASGSSSASAATSAKPSAAAGGATAAPPAAEPPIFATLIVNGRTQQLALGKLFPRGDPIFVLAKLDKKTARIGVAGGSFTDGNTLLLELGKPVTLMNTTTGQRYVVKLVYTGAQPETIAVFKGGKVATAAATGAYKP